jgi:hypothetical protein
MTITYRVNPKSGDAIEIEPVTDADKGAGAWVTVTDDSNPTMSVLLNPDEVGELREVLEKVADSLKQENR